MMAPCASSIYLCSLLFLSMGIIYSQAECSCDLPGPDFATNVNLLYYKCNVESTTIAFPLRDPVGLLDVLEDKRTIFYAFGYLENPTVKNVQTMMQALCYGRTDNIVLLDWSQYTLNLYPISFQNAEKVGSLYAQSIRILVDNGLNISNIYLIGHSLGAHITGLVGKCNNDFVIPRITGLDPASEIFYPPGCYLTAKDAAWVDIIHTDMGGYGTSTAMGTADYYINGGYPPQPGCVLVSIPLSDPEICSHQRSINVYATSKYYPAALVGMQCASYFAYKLNMCNNNYKTGVGYAASNDAQGPFYVTTGVL